MSEDVKLELKKLVGKLVTTHEVNPDLVKRLKSICKRDDGNVRVTFSVLLSFLKRPHSLVRLHCVQIMDTLFSRSHCFRTLLLDNFESFVSLTLGMDPSSPLPPPESQKKKLRQESIRKIKEWFNVYGKGYKKLETSYNVLKDVVDFEDLCLMNDEDRRKQREREERMENIWRSRIEKIELDFRESEADVASWMLTATNLLSLATANEGPYKDNVMDHYALLIKRWLPKVQSWVDTLTKSGNRTNHELLRKSVDLKNLLSEKKRMFETLDICFDHSDPVIENNAQNRPTSPSQSQDPTSWHATIKKVTGSSNIDMNIELTDKSDSKPSSSNKSTSESSAVPQVRLADLTEPDRMIVDPDKSRFWVSDHREGEEIFVGAPQKITEFAGEAAPVRWRCRVVLPSGALCPRMDRVRCPLHGDIVARDELGRRQDTSSNAPSTSTSTSSQSAREKKVPRKSSKMKSASKFDDCSRSRISKKIFNKSSAKRVAKDLKNYDKIRTKDKFVDQFNY